MTRPHALRLLFLSFLILVPAVRPAAAGEDLAELQARLAAEGAGWTAGETSVSGIPWAEFQQRLGLRLPPDYVVPPPDPEIEAKTFRSRFDLREEGGVTGVRNQGDCGSCWAFAQTAAFESRIRYSSGVAYDLSEQQMVDCNTRGYGCDGGWLDSYNIWANYGAVAESCYPYEAEDGACRQNQCPDVVHADGGHTISNTVNSIKNAVQNHGGVASAMTVFSDFRSYTGGCYSHAQAGTVNHAVMILGWDDSLCSGNGAWIAQNSWGTNWGEDGFFYIQYGHASIGYGATVIDYTPQDRVDLAVAGQAVDDSAGNGDGYIDPGETIVLAVTLANQGTVTATGITAQLTTETPGVAVEVGSADWPDIAAGGASPSLTPHFRLAVGSGVTEGTRILAHLAIHCSDGDFAGEIPLTVGRVMDIFYDGFENGDNGWTHAQLQTQDDWQRGAPQGGSDTDPPAAHGGTRIWGNDLAPSGWDGDYKNSVHNYLQSPAIDCSDHTGVSLTFYRWLAIEKGIYDQATIKVNGIPVWQNDPDVDHIDTAWVPVSIDISAIADENPSVVVRFELQSDGGVVFGGWNIDDLALRGVAATGATPTPTPSPSATFTPTPPPGSTATPTPPPPTPTPLPENLILTLFINDAAYTGGDRMRLDLEVRGGQIDRDADLWVALEVYGSYYFYPGWGQVPEYVRLYLAADGLLLVPVLDLELPDPIDPAGPFNFHALATDPGTVDLASNLATVTFRFE